MFSDASNGKMGMSVFFNGSFRDKEGLNLVEELPTAEIVGKWSGRIKFRLRRKSFDFQLDEQCPLCNHSISAFKSLSI